MKWPVWASPSHPLVRRELGAWRKHRRQLWLTFLLIPGLCTAVYWASFIIPAYRRGLSEIPSAFLLTLWAWEGVLCMWLSVVATTRAISLIAQERETQNWPLLRITPLDPHEITRSKIGAVVYWLRWPIAFLLILRIVCVLFTAAASNGITAPQLALAALLAVIFAAELLVSMLYNCAAGLVVSSFTRATANANAIVYLLHTTLFLFIFLPIWMTLGKGISEGFGLYYLRPDYWSILGRSAILFIALIGAQGLLGGLMLIVATARAARIVE